MANLFSDDRLAEVVRTEYYVLRYSIFIFHGISQSGTFSLRIAAHAGKTFRRSDDRLLETILRDKTRGRPTNGILDKVLRPLHASIKRIIITSSRYRESCSRLNGSTLTSNM